MMTARPAFSIVFSTGVTLAERYGVTSDERRGRVISELIETESPNRWRLSIEYADFSEPLRKTIVIAHIELREQQISDVRYSHHEEYTRATSYGIWQEPVHAVHMESQQLRDDLMRAATLVWGTRIQASRGVGTRE
jgi:hypothetical protein